MVLDPTSDSGVPLDRVTADATPTISGSGATPGDTIKLKRADGTVLGTAVVDSNGKWSITPTAEQPEGLNNFKVTATDPAGNESAPTTVPVTIDTTAPAAPAAVLDPTSDSGTPLDNVTSDTTPTISGSGATPGDTITLKTASGTTLGTAVVAPNGSWSITPPPSAPQPEGLNNFKVTATDPAGNVSAATTVPVTIDTVPPSAPGAILSAASDTGVPADGITSDNTPTISGSGATPGDTIKLKDASGTVLGTAVVAPDGTWSITPAVQPDGLNNFKVTATDPGGNESAATTVPVRIDTAALNTDINLALQIRTDANNDGLIGPAELGVSTTLTSRATFSNSGGTAAVVGNKIVFTASNGATPLASQTVTLTSTDITNGYVDVAFLAPDPSLGLTQTVRANFVDLAGNQASAPVVSDSAQVLKDNTRATIDITAMSSDNGASPSDFLTSDNTLTYSGTIT